MSGLPACPATANFRFRPGGCSDVRVPSFRFSSLCTTQPEFPALKIYFFGLLSSRTLKDIPHMDNILQK